MDFRSRVYDLCKRIPRGRVSTYKDIARKLKSKAYRAVGNALNKNPYKNVPCHRVVGASGHLVGFASGIKKKVELLRKEGVKVVNNGVELEKYFHHL